MRKLLCRFANWILRWAVGTDLRSGSPIYINGKEYVFDYLYVPYTTDIKCAMEFNVIEK